MNWLWNQYTWYAHINTSMMENYKDIQTWLEHFKYREPELPAFREPKLLGLRQMTNLWIFDTSNKDVSEH